MFLYGASGHAKVIIDILDANHEPVEGLFDDNEAIRELLGYPVYRSSEVKGPMIISIGNNRIRKMIAETLDVSWGMAVHPSAIISSRASMGHGTVIMQGAIVQSCAKIGKHCIVNTGASVDHECVIGDYVHLSPHCTLCGDVHVGEGTWIGAGAVIRQGIKIGSWCTVGAGAVVVEDVEDGITVVALPARNIKYKDMNIKVPTNVNVGGG